MSAGLEKTAEEIAAEAAVEAKVTERLETKIQERLKELGFDDHAKKVIEKVNAQAKSEREAREKADAAVKELREKETARETEIREAAEKVAAEKKKGEDDEKPLRQQLADLQQEFKAELKKRDDMSAAEKKAFDERLRDRDKVLVHEAVRLAAVKRGIIDEDWINLFDITSVKADNGKVDTAALTALLDAMEESKPHFFKKPGDTDTSSPTGVFERPDAKKDDTKGGTDWSKVDPTKFAAEVERLRQARS